MRNMLYLRPVKGARVLDPDAVPVPEALPVEGKAVVDTPYWRRRLKAGEVEKTTPGVVMAGRAAREAREELDTAKAALAEQQEKAAQEALNLEAKAASDIAAAKKAEQEAKKELAALRAETAPSAQAAEGGTGKKSKADKE